MRKFAEAYPDIEILQHPVAKLPWKNNITLMTKIKDKEKRDWYIAKNLENGWNKELKMKLKKGAPKEVVKEFDEFIKAMSEDDE